MAAAHARSGETTLWPHIMRRDTAVALCTSTHSAHKGLDRYVRYTQQCRVPIVHDLYFTYLQSKMNPIEITIAQEVQARPFLYNQLDKDNINNEKKTAAFNEMADIINRVHDEIYEEVTGNYFILLLRL